MVGPLNPNILVSFWLASRPKSGKILKKVPREDFVARGKARQSIPRTCYHDQSILIYFWCSFGQLFAGPQNREALKQDSCTMGLECWCLYINQIPGNMRPCNPVDDNHLEANGMQNYHNFCDNLVKVKQVLSQASCVAVLTFDETLFSDVADG